MTRATQASRRHARRAGEPAEAIAPPSSVRVAIYLRISTDEEHQPFSLEAQEHRLLAFIPTQPGWMHVQTYRDQTSGAKADRKDLNRALSDARLGKFDVLLVYRVDRFARSLKVLVDLLGSLESCSVAFRSATEPIDTGTPTGRMLVQLLGVFAEFERATIIDRVVNGMERKAARGGWAGGTLPFGLVTDESGHLAIGTQDDAGNAVLGDRNNFAVIEQIFDRYGDGALGATAIAGELNRDGVRSKNGRPWTPQVILNILRNRCYVGEVYWRGEWFKSADPFIDPGLFDRVQGLLDARGESHDKRTTTVNPSYLLTSLVKCGRCKRNFVGVASHGKANRYRYYMCWTRNRYGASACPAARIRADELEAAVFDALVAVYSDPDMLREAAAERIAGDEAAAASRAASLRRIDDELRKADEAVERYMLAFEDGKLSADVFSDRVEQLGAKAQKLRARRAELEAEAASPGVADDLSDEAFGLALQELRAAAENAPDAVRKAVAQAFVDELRVVDDLTVHPFFRVLAGQAPAGGGPSASPYRCAYTDKQGGR